MVHGVALSPDRSSRDRGVPIQISCTPAQKERSACHFSADAMIDDGLGARYFTANYSSLSFL